MGCDHLGGRRDVVQAPRHQLQNDSQQRAGDHYDDDHRRPGRQRELAVELVVQIGRGSRDGAIAEVEDA